MKSIAIVLSGGRGLRIGTDLPKQYMEVCGKPLLAYALAAFQASCVEEVAIVAAEEYLETCRNIADSYGCSKVTAVIPGGAERYDSVRNGLRYFRNRQQASEQEPCIVLIHDGARPFIKPETIDRIVAETKQHRAVIAAAPCTDTIKVVDSQGYIVSTTDRQFTWAAQTPQAFYLDEISEAYETVLGYLNAGDNVSGLSKIEDTISGQPEAEAKTLSKSKAAAEELSKSDVEVKVLKQSDVHEKILPREKITDDAMVYQHAFPDRPVKVFPAGRENIKITHATDLIWAEHYLG